MLVEPHSELLFGIIAVGGMIHELGHAAAYVTVAAGTRYRCRLVLFYPVFYRRHRLLPHGTLGQGTNRLWWVLLTCSSFGLIIIVRGIDLLSSEQLRSTSRSCTESPFLRLDGYWTLTDLTGVGSRPPRGCRFRPRSCPARDCRSSAGCGRL